MKIKQAISEAGKNNKGIIMVHAATNDANPAHLNGYVRT